MWFARKRWQKHTLPHKHHKRPRKQIFHDISKSSETRRFERGIVRCTAAASSFSV